MPNKHKLINNDIIENTGNAITRERSWGDYGQLGISSLSFALSFSPYTAWAGTGIAVVDAFGEFNSFYEGLDSRNDFYNKTGIIWITGPNNLPIMFKP